MLDKAKIQKESTEGKYQSNTFLDETKYQPTPSKQNFEIVLNAEQLDVQRLSTPSAEDKLPTEVFLYSQCGTACEESYPSWHIAKYNKAL